MKRFLLSILCLTAIFSAIAAPDPLLMRTYADPYIAGVPRMPAAGAAGTLDSSFGTNGGRSYADTFGSNTIAQSIAIYPNGSFVVLVNDSTNVQVLVDLFNGDGYAVWNAPCAITFTSEGPYIEGTEVYLDSLGDVVVVGYGNYGAFIARVTQDGILDTTFNPSAMSPAVPGIALNTAVNNFTCVVQQQSGRYITVGTNSSSNPVIVAYATNGQVDATFNPLSESDDPGYFTFDSVSQINSLSIDPLNDYIYCAYLYTGAANTIMLAKIANNASYSTFVTITYNNVVSPSLVYSALDTSSAYPLVIAAIDNANNFIIGRYSLEGILDPTFNVVSDNPATQQIIAGTSGATITDVVIDQNNKILIVGFEQAYNVSADNDQQSFVLIRLNADGTLDLTFATSTNSPTGYLPYYYNAGIATADKPYGAAIHPSGQIMLVGYEQDENATPVVVRIYGDSYVPEYVQAPTASPAGTLDYTFGPQITFDGTLSPTINLNDLLDGQLDQNTPVTMNVFSDGSFLTTSYIVTSGPSGYLIKCYVARFNALYQLESTFNEGNVLTLLLTDGPGSLTSVALDLLSDQNDYAQNFYVAGTIYINEYVHFPWVQYLSSTGVVNPNGNFNFVHPSGMQQANVIVQQSFGRLLVGGNGIISGNTTTGALDTVFGNGNGYFVIDENFPTIKAMVVDSQDRILVAYEDIDSNAQVIRLDANGLGIDTTFTATPLLTSVQGVCLAVDADDNAVVAIVNESGFVVTRYLAISGAQDTTFNGTGQLSLSVDSPLLQSIAIESDGKIVLLGASNSDSYFTVIVRILSTGYIDTTFNAQGTTPSYPGLMMVENIQGSSFGIYPDRRMMVYGKDFESNVTLTRIFGDEDDYVTLLSQEPVAGVYGLADLSLNADGYQDCTALVGAGAAVAVVAIENQYSVVAFDNGTVTTIAQFTSDLTLDINFGTQDTGIAVTTCPTGVTDITVDSNGLILVVGNNTNGSAWIARYLTSGAIDPSFGTSGFVTIASFSAQEIKIQSIGRILISGLNITNGYGAMIAYTPSGTLDTSFGFGIGIVSNSATTSPIYTFFIDSLDRICLAFTDSSSQVGLVRYLPNGNGFDTTLNGTGYIPNALQATLIGASQVRIACDQNGNILIVGIDTGYYLVAARYTYEGVLDTTFGTSGYVSIATDGMVINDFVVGTTGTTTSDMVMAIIGSINMLPASPADYMFITWLDQDGNLAANFNPGDSAGSVRIIIDNANSVRALTSGTILSDGRLLLTAYEGTSIDLNNQTPYLVRRYGQRYAGQVAQEPIAYGEIGTLDPALNGNGTLAFNFTTGSVNQYAQSIYTLDNGFFLIGGYGTTNTDSVYNHFILTQRDSSGAIYPGFGDEGVVVSPLSTGNNEYLQDTTIDYLNRIIAVGYSDSGASIVRRYLADGTLDTTFGYTSGSLTPPNGTATLANKQLYAVGIQFNGRIIAIGSDTISGTGFIVGYDDQGSVDVSFGVNGFVHIAHAASLSSMVIDSDDSILISYQNISNSGANIVRIQNNGLPYIPSQAGYDFGINGTIFDIFDVNAADVKIAVDEQDNIIVAATYIPGRRVNGLYNAFLVRRYLSSGQVDTTFNTDGSTLRVFIEDAGASPELTRLMANTVGQYVLVGYSEFAQAPMIAQVANDGTVDLTFNAAGTPGYNLFTIPGGGTNQVLNSAVISDEGLIIAVGDEVLSSAYTPVMIAMFDTQYSPEVPRQPEFVGKGQFDYSFGTNGIAPVYANGDTDPSANQEARAVRQVANQQLMSIVSDGTQAWSVRVDTDGTVTSNFGSGNGVLIAQHAGNEVVNQMQLDGSDNMLIVGNNDEFGGYIKRVLSPTGGMDPLFGGNNGDPIGTVYFTSGQTALTNVYAVAQMSTGNILVVGTNAGLATAVMLTSTGQVATAFGSLGNGIYVNNENSLLPGVYATSVSVDALENIYLSIGYWDGDISYFARVVKLTSAGILDTSFGTNGIVDPVISYLDNMNNIRLALDINNNIVIAASWDGGLVGVTRLTSTGAVDPIFNSGNQFNISCNVDAAVALTRLIPLTNGYTILSGYTDGNIDGNVWFIAQLDYVGTYDDTFNAQGQTPGLLTFDIGNPPFNFVSSNDSVVQADGKVVMAGGQSITDNNETPYLVRLLDMPNVQAVPQYPGTVTPINTLEIMIDPLFGNAGIAQATAIGNLREGGYLATDRVNRIVVGGTTLDNRLLVNRFLPGGTLDVLFGIAGTTMTTSIPHLVHGGSVSVDNINRIIIGGMTSDYTLVVARFTADGTLDTSFGTGGIVATTTIANLSNGGFTTVDNRNRVLIGGITADYKLVVTRFTELGDLDTSFNGSGIFRTASLVPDGFDFTLAAGGYIVTDILNNVYIGGSTTTGTLICVGVSSTGVQGFISESEQITGLIGNGTIALDSLSRIIVAGYTNQLSLVAVRFGADGAVDTHFGVNGIAISMPVPGLEFGGAVCVDNQNRIAIGGVVLNAYQRSMIVARFTPFGVFDPILSSVGVASTGVITSLAQGGFIVSNNFGAPLLGGMTIDGLNNKLLVAGLYSGNEIFIPDPALLTPVQQKLLFYGNNATEFRRMMFIDYFLGKIAPSDVLLAVSNAVDGIFNSFIAQYAGTNGSNFILQAYLNIVKLEAAKVVLELTYPDSVDAIDTFFANQIARITALAYNPR